MQTEMLRKYLSGEPGAERGAVQELRHAGEVAAQRLRLQPCDADAVGVDFAAYILSARNMDRIRLRKDLERYLRQAARWYAAKHCRTVRSRRVVLNCEIGEARAEDPVQDPASIAVRHELLGRIARVVGSLPVHEQRLYRLCLVNGYNCAEASSHLGCTPAAARKRLERLRSLLRRKVRPD